jgi:hypothetical protein
VLKIQTFVGKGCSLYRTPGPEPIEIKVTSFLVGICNFVIQSGMSFEFEGVFTPVWRRRISRKLASILTSSFGSKVIGRILVATHFWKYQLEINRNYNSRYKCVQVLRVNFV